MRSGATFVHLLLLAQKKTPQRPEGSWRRGASKMPSVGDLSVKIVDLAFVFFDDVASFEFERRREHIVFWAELFGQQKHLFGTLVTFEVVGVLLISSRISASTCLLAARALGEVSAIPFCLAHLATLSKSGTITATLCGLLKP